MKLLFLHGWQLVPGGLKPTYLKQAGQTVLNPALVDEDFAAAVRTVQAEYDQHQPDVVVGSSRGGAVAMNIQSGNTPARPALPSMEALGNCHDGQTQHSDSSQPQRRNNPLRRLRGIDCQQWLARLGVDQSWQ